MAVGFMACVGGDPTPSTPADAAVNDSSPSRTDASVDPPAGDAGDGGDVQIPRCDRDAPFGAPEPIEGVHDLSSNNTYPRPTAAGIYFTSDRHNPPPELLDLSRTDLFFAPRRAVGYGLATRLDTISTAGADAAPTESADGLSLYFEAAPGGDGSEERRLHRATRQSATAPWGNVAALRPFADSLNDTAPYLVGSTLYFASERADAGGYRRLYRVAVDDGGLAGTPSEVPGIEPSWDVRFPVVSQDETTIYFGRLTTGSKVYVASRTTTGIPFAAGTELSVVNIKSVAVPTAISADGCELGLHMRSDGERFGAYVARRPAL